MKRTDVPSLVVVAVLCLLIGRHLHGLTRRPAPRAAPVERAEPAAPESAEAPPVAVTGAFAVTRTAVAEWPAGQAVHGEPVPETGAHVVWLE